MASLLHSFTTASACAWRSLQGHDTTIVTSMIFPPSALVSSAFFILARIMDCPGLHHGRPLAVGAFEHCFEVMMMLWSDRNDFERFVFSLWQSYRSNESFVNAYILLHFFFHYYYYCSCKSGDITKWVSRLFQGHAVFLLLVQLLNRFFSQLECCCSDFYGSFVWLRCPSNFRNFARVAQAA